MILFIDGPAKNQQLLNMTRAPIMLRVVYNVKTHKWNALNELEDTIEDDEVGYVYRMIGGAAVGFVDGRDRKTGKRWSSRGMMATYEYLTDQPDSTVIRDNEKWGEWCDANKEKLLKEKR